MASSEPGHPVIAQDLEILQVLQQYVINIGLLRVCDLNWVVERTQAEIKVRREQP